MKHDSGLTGEAGEHLVLSRLLFMGILAGQVPRGTSKADILLNFLADAKPCLIQVKTRRSGSDGGWHLQEKHEEIKDKNLFYCFVDFEPENAIVYVVPAAKVADVIASSHRVWLATPGKKGQQHNQTVLRRVRPNYPFAVPSAPDGWLEKYKENWDLLLN